MRPEVQHCEEVHESSDGKNICISPQQESTLEYQEELSQLYEWIEAGKIEISKETLCGKLQYSHFRSVIWRILLGVLPVQKELWVKKLQQQREDYWHRVHLRVITPHPKIDDHPLSQSDSSVWHQYFCDKELKAVIEKDVLRTFPSEAFFRSEKIREMMINILFCYARENPALCYRQGMHEILAPLLYVLHTDQQALCEACEVKPIEGPIRVVLDNTCLEEDGYFLFDSVMKHQACTYHTNDLSPSSTGYFSKLPERETEVIRRLIVIRDSLLKDMDPDLRQHMLDLDIPLVFGLRWLRILFGQEFPMANLLLLWDAIFAAEKTANFIDYIVVAMLVEIRDRLLVEDFSGCLDLLMHYPTDIKVSSIVTRALCMHKPKEFPPPYDMKFFDKPAPKSLTRDSADSVSRLRRLFAGPGKNYTPPTTNKASSRSGSMFSRLGTMSRKVLPFSGQTVQSSFVPYHSKVSPWLVVGKRLASCYKILSEHFSSGVPTNVQSALQDLKEISEMIVELSTAEDDVETAVEAKQSPGSPAECSATAIPRQAANGHTPPESESPISVAKLGRDEKEIALVNMRGHKDASTRSEPIEYRYVDPLRRLYLPDHSPPREHHTDYFIMLGNGLIFSALRRPMHNHGLNI